MWMARTRAHFGEGGFFASLRAPSSDGIHAGAADHPGDSAVAIDESAPLPDPATWILRARPNRLLYAIVSGFLWCNPWRALWAPRRALSGRM